MAGRKPKSAAVGRSDFAALLADVKGRIQAAQTRAVLAVNAELVRLYWDIGQMIDGRQRREGWGAAVIPRLAKELKNELPELKGFSERNIDRMIAFYRAYPDPAGFSPPAVAKLLPQGKVPQVVAKSSTQIVQGAPAQTLDSLLWSVPWAHHVVLMEKVKDRPTRRWYMEQTLANGWSRNVLGLQIDARAHVRHGTAVSNFAALLPAPQSDLAQQALKDPYIFDFLTLTEPFQERELETQLVRHLEKFLLELGQGFAFVGRQYRLDVGDEDFYIDLLFYHLRLRSFVVIDLKKGKFKPEYAGKLNFYCNVVNDRLKHPTDAPTIGLILCQTRDQLLAEYSFAGIDKPIGISTYELTRALPARLRSVLPTVEEIEAELSGKPRHPSAGKMGKAKARRGKS
ncbi:MAG: PDDEXK nuclease domain-containing protein [Candidatus Latescibacterota bacterium]|jgi:predicted nuclease of restriction endonuclease-like (RecB) superfamily